MRNKKLGPIEVYLTRDQVNALLMMLDTMIVSGYDCSFGDMAKALREKIIKYGKPIRRGDLDEVVICFYDNEAEKLIALNSLYLALITRDLEDYYPEIGLRYRQGLGESKAAEQRTASQLAKRSVAQDRNGHALRILGNQSIQFAPQHKTAPFHKTNTRKRERRTNGEIQHQRHTRQGKQSPRRKPRTQQPQLHCAKCSPRSDPA